MVSALEFGSNGPDSSPGRSHCVVFLRKTLYSHTENSRLTRCINGYTDGLGSHPGMTNSHSSFKLKKPAHRPAARVWATGLEHGSYLILCDNLWHQKAR